MPPLQDVYGKSRADGLMVPLASSADGETSPLPTSGFSWPASALPETSLDTAWPYSGVRRARRWQLTLKRALDIGAAGAGLLALSPLMAGLACAIKLTSPGPVFYRQRRVGLEGRHFELVKFRTMVVDAETETGPVWAANHDSRCTGVGQWLRRTSLDELPQLWNVLKGEMSLVGPRPERPVFANQFAKEMPDYAMRHRVPVGMTGWAQVHGWRGNTSIQARLAHDLEYIENWSPRLDLRILRKTICGGFLNPNA